MNDTIVMNNGGNRQTCNDEITMTTGTAAAATL